MSRPARRAGPDGRGARRARTARPVADNLCVPSAGVARTPMRLDALPRAFSAPPRRARQRGLTEPEPLSDARCAKTASAIRAPRPAPSRPPRHQRVCAHPHPHPARCCQAPRRCAAAGMAQSPPAHPCTTLCAHHCARKGNRAFYWPAHFFASCKRLRAPWRCAWPANRAAGGSARAAWALGASLPRCADSRGFHKPFAGAVHL